ncbi:BTAD domain-containing putative transcriptional regulator, partial [Dactylosporangium sp. NPDC000521]|uniref:BTAD domain-containing putative transcriptional regulator n=1 Tax=Dactylosporangium sp. NPDC000521 TaxID=3363975 RepID=UPI0036A15502
AASLRAAIALHTGDLGGTATQPWLEAPRERCRQQGITARQRLAALVAITQPAEAAALLDAAADIDPHSDALARAAIEAFAALGATYEAHHRYQQLRTALADIDEQPEAATVAAIEAVLDGTEGHEDDAA